MTTIQIVDVVDALEVLTDKRYTHIGNNKYQSPIGTIFVVPEALAITITPIKPTKNTITKPKTTGKMCQPRTREIIEGEVYVILASGPMLESEWQRILHPGGGVRQPRPMRVVPTLRSEYSLGRTKRGRPCIKRGRQIIEWGFKSVHETQARLDRLQEDEYMENKNDNN